MKYLISMMIALGLMACGPVPDEISEPAIVRDVDTEQELGPSELDGFVIDNGVISGTLEGEKYLGPATMVRGSLAGDDYMRIDLINDYDGAAMVRLRLSRSIHDLQPGDSFTGGFGDDYEVNAFGLACAGPMVDNWTYYDAQSLGVDVEVHEGPNDSTLVTFELFFEDNNPSEMSGQFTFKEEL